MKILKLLNKKYFLVIIIFLLRFCVYAENQPVDIWNTNNSNTQEVSKIDSSEKKKQKKNKTKVETSIYEMQTKKKDSSIELDQNLGLNQIKIIGLYDPDDYGLDINMWSNSDGDQLKNIFSRLEKIELSGDATEIMNISMLTNAFSPNKNISKKEFLKFKADWLIKNSDLELIEEYLIKNQVLDNQSDLAKHLVDMYLSKSDIKKACEIFSKNLLPINDKYLSKFNIYCLINLGKVEEAQLALDLKKELGFQDEYFEKKINFLLGYSDKVDVKISEKSILDFHLAHRTNPNFNFEPKNSTDKLIWKYLSSSNLLKTFQEIEISELDKISLIEKAVQEKNYPEKDLLEIYKRFQFDINQLLNAEKSHKSLSNIEARALIYQKILLESKIEEKIKLLKILKNSLENENLGGAFDDELKFFLEQMDPLKIPDNLTSFYYTNIQVKKETKKKIKFNNDILHQSKLITYFNGEYSQSKIEKDINNFLKKIKKNKKYFISKQDIIFLESLRSDGIKIDKKYDDLYEIDNSEIPTDLQVMINNDEKGAALLRIVEVIGQDELPRIDEDTMLFIISTLNQLNISFIRNQILLKVLPLKV